MKRRVRLQRRSGEVRDVLEQASVERRALEEECARLSSTLSETRISVQQTQSDSLARAEEADQQHQAALAELQSKAEQVSLRRAQ